ncbi:MAG TPA: flagellar basal body rod protein FlgC [Candidatus Deferrimicrobium sp.]|nr:flagellar basal body rod protein FlgC [Candidatus Kapabacteria bacterium]HLP60308.1 flagellar basal body rod protein FlgC [Candidatus Deferrimicrobium sp.]
MSLESVFDINASGMKAQMLRMEVLSSNIANINATRTPEGGPYRRRDVVFESTPVGESFDDALNAASAAENTNTRIGVEVSQVVEDPSPFKQKYDPGHPDAGPDGYVLFPNVDVVSEMVNVQEAARSYEANIAVILAVKNMIAKTFEIGRR